MSAKNFLCVLMTMAAVSMLWLATCMASDVEAKKMDKSPLQIGSLSGTVVDPDGKPVSGARVWVDASEGKRLAETRSDGNGHVHLHPVVAVYRHRFFIFIEAEGFARQYVRRGSYSVFPGVDCDLGRIRVDRGRIFTGQVLDVDGRPCPDVEVVFSVLRYDLGHTVEEIVPEQRTTTDSQGRFRTRPLPVGELCVWTSPPNRRLAWTRRTVQPGGEEVLEPLRVERDVPVHGIVRDSTGKPVVGAEFNANAEHKAVSDSEGRFTLHGFGPPPEHFQLQMHTEGSLFINWGVDVRKDGIYWHEVGDNTHKEHGPLHELLVTLKPQAWIEGRATDAETGEPVQLKRVVICSFERKSSGEVVLSGCRSPRFEQAEVGRFRVPYSDPIEYHLTLSAEGYHDAEAFTPKITELKPISGVVVKLKRRKEGTTPGVAKQTISGTATRNGNPLEVGWVGLWMLRRQQNVGNAWMLRSRTVVGDPITYASARLNDGRYSLEVPYQDDAWYVVVEEPGHALTQVGPLKIALNEKKSLDIACTEGGGVRGRVNNVQVGWKGHLWVVAFTKTAIQLETRVNSDDTFSFSQLPPGTYGLKVGYDGYLDSEVPTWGPDTPKDAWEKKSDPWQRAKVVTVESGRQMDDVELELPPDEKK